MNILIFNQKGGVGKTTTALNLGVGLSRLGKNRVTLVDLDPQTHLTVALGFQTERFTWNVTDWLTGRVGEPQIIDERLSLIAGHYDFSDAVEFTTVPNRNGVVIIDSPPVWNKTVARLMEQVDWIITPLEPEFMSTQGVSCLIKSMEKNHISREKLRLLLCRYDTRLITHREIREKLQQRFGDNLLGCVIRKSVRLAESPSYGWSIFDYAPDSAGASDYTALTQYWLKKFNKKIS